MAAKTKAAAKTKRRNYTKRPEYVAPGFADLLDSAVHEPGIVSACYHMGHDYTFHNKMLVHWQCAVKGIEFGPIGTWKFWEGHGRKVVSGPGSALSMAMPTKFPVKKLDKVTGEEEEVMVTKFIYPYRWFVLSQTEGDDLPPVEVADWQLDRALDALAVHEESFKEGDVNCMGYAHIVDGQKLVACNPLNPHRAKTFMHELAHHVLGHTGDADMSDDAEVEPRSVRELEAEAVAYIVSESLGDHTGAAESRGYIQNWYTEDEVPEKVAKRIFKAAQTVLDAGLPAKPKEAV